MGGALKIILREIILKGWLGKKAESKILLRPVEKERARKRKKYEEVWKKEYQKICSSYSEIRVHTLVSSNRIGEFLPCALSGYVDTKVNCDKGILDLFILDNYELDNDRVTEIVGRHIHIVTPRNYKFWRYVLNNYSNVCFTKYIDEYW